jgi:hypothetical protein
MVAAGCSEMSVHIYQMALHYIPEDSNNLGSISGFMAVTVKRCGLVGCNAMQVGGFLTFWRNILPPSLGLKSKLYKKSAEADGLFPNYMTFQLKRSHSS